MDQPEDQCGRLARRQLRRGRQGLWHENHAARIRDRRQRDLVYQGAIDNRPSSDGDPRTARNYVRETVQKLQAGEKLDVSQTKPYGCGVKYGG